MLALTTGQGTLPMLAKRPTSRATGTTLLLAVATAFLLAPSAQAQPPGAGTAASPPARPSQAAGLRARMADPSLDMPDAPSWVDPRLRHLGSSAVALRNLTPGPGGEDVVPILIRGPVATAVLRGMGVEVQSEIDQLRTARVPLSALSSLVRVPGIEHLTLGYRLQPSLNVSVPETRADVKRAQAPPLWGWYGKNVIVGFVDSGFDYQHDDFRNPDGSTRFLSIWDQNAIGVPPSGYTYGNECTAAQINAGTCPETDADGHGSHVAGIAAGDGSATGNFEPQYIYTGMADGAQLIGVATDFTFQGVVDGVNYVFQRAALLGKPAVVNLSLGTGLGPHDGTTDFELALNALTGPGKIICASAGNGQLENMHASQNVQSSVGTFSFTVPSYTANSGGGNDYISVDMWHAAANAYSVKVKRPSSSSLVGPVAKGASQSFSTVDGQIIIDYTNTNDPNGNGMSEIYVEINDVLGTPPRAGSWQIQLTPAGVPGTPIVHSWMDAVLGPTGLISTFTANVDTTVLVTAPATADSLIAVAAYTSKREWASIDGQIYFFSGAVQPYQICPFSARGPRRDSVQKPDITAPGSAIVSVLSADSNPPWPTSLIVPDGVHLALQGTSMASPHVAGAVAMLLQKYPTLSPAGAKALLLGAARSDLTTGSVPNPRWGAGRLNLLPLLCSDTQAPVVAATYPGVGNDVYVGTQVGLTWTATDDAGVTSVKLEYRIAPAGPWTLIAQDLPNIGYYAWTVPALAGQQVQIQVTAFDCVGSVSAMGPAVTVRTPSVATPSDLPVRFAAYRPVPNPFALTSAVRFDLPAAPAGQWPVDVSIYNVAGRRVRTLVHGALPGGRYAYAWDGRDDSSRGVAAGIYFVQISAGAFGATERIIYLR